LLARALQEGEGAVAADVLWLDAVATAKDDEGVHAGLRRRAERAAPSRRVGPLLLLAARARAAGQADAARDILREAREGSPTDTTVVRTTARALQTFDPARAADAWLAEASASYCDLAAFAAKQAAHMQAAAGADPTDALRRAVEVASYAPAAWALEPHLR